MLWLVIVSNLTRKIRIKILHNSDKQKFNPNENLERNFSNYIERIIKSLINASQSHIFALSLKKNNQLTHKLNTRFQFILLHYQATSFLFCSTHRKTFCTSKIRKRIPLRSRISSSEKRARHWTLINTS